ncbi:MAG TPA: CHASE3 domain-containing protein [Terracidiphilus sp.]|nr:CHASE3 domain-containing protein [Terracidiphilus sp.]
MQRRRFLSKQQAILGIASLVLLTLVGLSYRQWEDYRHATLAAERSREISAMTERILATVTAAEAGQRGFLLTTDSRYLEPYNRAIQELPNDLSTLRMLISESHGETEDFEKLNTLTNGKMNELRETIEMRRTQGARAALSIVLNGEGKRTMDSIRTLCAQIQRNESANQALESADRENAAGIVLLITTSGSLLALFLFAFGLEPFASPDPQAWQRPWFTRYGAAILAVLVIALLRGALTPLIGSTNLPFTMFFCAVAFAAWFGGPRPAMLSIVLSLLVGDWFFAAPTQSFLVKGRDDQVTMLLMVLVGFGIAILSRSQRIAVDRARRAEDSERAERERFETTLASIGDAVIATDASGRVIFMNRVASELLKWPETEVHGRDLDEVFRIVHQSTRTEVESPVRRVLREGQIIGLTNHTVLICRDGTEVPIDDSAAPICDSDGRIQGTVLVFRDVTERRRTEKRIAEQALLLERAASDAQSQRQRLGLALMAGKMGVYEVKPIENVFWWSPETYSLFGVNPLEFKPTRNSFAALIHPKDRESFMQYWDKNLADYQPINQEFRVWSLDGKERWISCRGMPKYDESGMPIHYSGLFLDVTERKGAEEVLRQFEKLSAAARLSAAIAHEINNPLGAVTNLIYLAKQAPEVPGPVVEQLALAEEELERVAHAARQALGFYRESLQPERIDVPELIESVLKIFATRIALRKIKVERSLLQCSPVYGVRGEIRQVISNLLVNAIEAVNEGGTIFIGTQPVGTARDQAVEIMITDDGHGIASEHLDHIFEPFFTTKAGTGTGLGLWVAKEIIERHRGSIKVQQSDATCGGCGTTFIVRLPGNIPIGDQSI